MYKDLIGAANGSSKQSKEREQTAAHVIWESVQQPQGVGVYQSEGLHTVYTTH